MSPSPVQSAIHLSTDAQLSGAERETPLSAPAQEAPPEILPRGFGRYTLETLLGRGAMGSVYLAYDPQLDRRVALKVPRPLVEDGKVWRDRFLTEARAAATLHHPQICPVYEVGEIESQPYLTMAFIEGETLAERLKRTGTVPPAEAAELIAAISRAMAEAHERGIIHRDLKPANIMLDRRGQPVIMDFGLAMRFEASDDQRLTRSGMALGTPCYMSPEQASGDHRVIGPSADIYSLGVILFELVTGRLPFQEKTFSKLMAQIERDPPPSPQSLNPAVDEKLVALILRALAKKPEQRFASASAFADALEAYLRNPSADPASPVKLQETSSWQSPVAKEHARSRQRIILVLMGFMVAIVAAVTIYIQTNDGDLQLKINDPDAKNLTYKVNGNAVQINDDGKLVDIRVGKDQKLEVSGPGYKSVGESFEIKRGKTTVLSIALKKLPPPRPPPSKEVIEIPGWQIIAGVSRDEFQTWLAEQKKNHRSVLWIDVGMVGKKPLFSGIAALDERAKDWQAILDLTIDETQNAHKIIENRHLEFEPHCVKSMGAYFLDQKFQAYGLFCSGRPGTYGVVDSLNVNINLSVSSYNNWQARAIRPGPDQYGNIHYGMSFEKGGFKARYKIYVDEESLLQVLEEPRKTGERLVSVVPFQDGVKRRFAYVLVNDNTESAWELSRDLTLQELKTKAAELAKKNLAPVSISVCELDGEARFTTVWDKEKK